MPRSKGTQLNISSIFQDGEHHEIMVFRDDGKYIRSIGNGHGSDVGMLDSPGGIAIDKQLLYVADCKS